MYVLHLETNGVEVFDIVLNQLVLVVSPLMCVLADNPRASELLNHLGSTATNFCRMCMRGSYMYGNFNI